ncbi:MAG: HTH-type transcriptional activator RhaR [Saprospiraceae bacterium]|nr:HTH-type transcriptional activator RhaR [Saprospiraceae bacterium]
MLEGKHPPDPQPAGVALVRQFQELLEENFRRSANRLKTVQEFADALRVHPNHLSATTKETLGKTAGELLQERLLTEAKSLLLHSGLTVKEIEYQLDFETPNYFSRFFKKHTGRTPGDFRSQI